MPDHNPDSTEPRRPEPEASGPWPAPEPASTEPGFLAEPRAADHADYLAPDFGLPADDTTAAEPGIPGGPRLLVWLILLVVLGTVSVLLNLQEAAVLAALAGLYVAAQAADIYPGQRALYWMLTWTVPVGGAMVFSGFAWVISQMEPSPLQMTMVAMAATAALVCLMTIFRPFSDSLSRALFRHQEPSHALRLSARLVVMCMMLALPGWYAFRDAFERLLTESGSLFDHGFLGSGLIGYVVLALAAVGFMVRRDLPQTLERLGVRPLKPADYAIIPLGVLLMFGMNVGLEAIQRTWFTDLWLSDQRVTMLIASGLGVGQVIMLGLSAGIGEEITLRGALQPRLGLWLTSLLFAALHIQYSWFGMIVIFLFGIVLGILRNRTSTTVVMAIHTLYDMAAVFSIPQPT
jgi:hypothetical protein